MRGKQFLLLHDRCGERHRRGANRRTSRVCPEKGDLNPRFVARLPGGREIVVVVDRYGAAGGRAPANREHGHLGRVVDFRHQWSLGAAPETGQAVPSDLKPDNLPRGRQPAGHLKGAAGKGDGGRRNPGFGQIDGQLVVHHHPARADRNPYSEAGCPRVEQCAPMAVVGRLLRQHAVGERHQHVADPIPQQGTGRFQGACVFLVKAASACERPAEKGRNAVPAHVADQAVFQHRLGGGVPDPLQQGVANQGLVSKIISFLIDTVENQLPGNVHIRVRRLAGGVGGHHGARQGRHRRQQQADPSRTSSARPMSGCQVEAPLLPATLPLPGPIRAVIAFRRAAMVHFGTSGWRGIVGQDFTFREVRLVMEAALHVLRETGEQAEILVSYDTRLLSEKFAHEAVAVCTHHDWPVVISDRDVPTPCLAFQVRRRRSGLGVMFTASHNPPEYNGIKLFTRDGAAPLDFTDRIEAEVRRRSAAFDDFFVPQKHLASTAPLGDDYLAALQDGIDWEVIRAAGVRVVVDPLFGTAREFLDRLLLANGIHTAVLHTTKDPYFGGYSPECTPKNLEVLRERVRETGAHLGLATDGDADRFGVVDSACRVVPANLAVALLVEYLLTRRRVRGGVGRTVGTTRLVDRITEANDCPVLETPVGFSHFAPLFAAGQVVLAVEESAGMGVASHLPERDGIFAALLVAEMIAVERKSVQELVRRLFARHGTRLSRRVDLPWRERTRAALRRLEQAGFSEFAGRAVLRTDRQDGLFMELEGGGWVFIRRASTEPRVRLYAEATSSGELRVLVRELRRLVRRAEEGGQGVLH